MRASKFCLILATCCHCNNYGWSYKRILCCKESSWKIDREVCYTEQQVTIQKPYFFTSEANSASATTEWAPTTSSAISITVSNPSTSTPTISLTASLATLPDPSKDCQNGRNYKSLFPTYENGTPAPTAGLESTRLRPKIQISTRSAWLSYSLSTTGQRSVLGSTFGLGIAGAQVLCIGHNVRKSLAIVGREWDGVVGETPELHVGLSQWRLWLPGVGGVI